MKELIITILCVLAIAVAAAVGPSLQEHPSPEYPPCTDVIADAGGTCKGDPELPLENL